jgi:hypothetical protein
MASQPGDFLGRKRMRVEWRFSHIMTLDTFPAVLNGNRFRFVVGLLRRPGSRHTINAKFRVGMAVRAALPTAVMLKRQFARRRESIPAGRVGTKDQQ